MTPAVLDQEDRLLQTDNDKAELLNDFFVRQAAQSSVSGEPQIIILPRVTAEDEILHEFRVSPKRSEQHYILLTLLRRQAVTVYQHVCWS